MNKNSSSILRVVVGGYLIYLAYGLFKDLRAGVIDKPALFVAAIILFVVSGAAIIFVSVKEIAKQSKMSAEEVADEALDEELEAAEEVYGMYTEPALTDGKMEGINKELAKLNQADEAGSDEVVEENQEKSAQSDIE